jgi:hypothetical protein
LRRRSPESARPRYSQSQRSALLQGTLGDDFRDIRELVFGPDEKRQIADFRRTGIVEALAGGVDPKTLSSKMANNSPVQLVRVCKADAAWKRGRAMLRDQENDEPA